MKIPLLNKPTISRIHFFIISAALLAVLAASQAFAGKATVTWHSNQESDLAGYNLYYGKNKGFYEKSIDVGMAAQYTLTELDDNIPYYFTLTAYDQLGNESAYSQEVSFTNIVNQCPVAPSSPLGPANGYALTAYTFDTSASDPDGDDLQYQFNWGDKSKSQWGPASQSHQWLTAGSYCVKARAADPDGALSEWSGCLNLVLEPLSYTVAASPGANGTISPVGEVSVAHGTDQTFTISADENCHVAEVMVDGKSVGPVQSYTFTSVDTSHTISAVFSPNNQLPVAEAGADQLVDRGTIVTLNGSGSRDPDDGIASYAWRQVSGIPVILKNPKGVETTFISPPTATPDISLAFALTVTDHSGAKDEDTCAIVFTANPYEDLDQDGINDSHDNCPGIGNSEQVDKDTDGVGDPCDAFKNDRNEWLDSDKDGIGDNADPYDDSDEHERRVSPQWRIHHRSDRGRKDHLPSNKAYRTFDGSGNNLDNPDWGAADTQLLRFVPSNYADGISTLAGPGRPEPLEISNAVVDQPGSILNPLGASDYLWQWAQFLDHDIGLTDGADPPEPENIPIPTGDPVFDPDGLGGKVFAFNRSIYDTGTGAGNPRQQLNEITAFVDASNVYGSDEERALELRTNDGTGKLKTSAGNLLPFNTAKPALPNAGGPSEDLFVAGDVRANEQASLTAMHTLFVREHNRLAEEIAAADHGLSGDEIYERARKIVGAQMQVITYREFLPALMGPSPLSRYRGYKPNVNPGIGNMFSAAIFRLGHTLLSPILLRLDADGNEIPEGHLSLSDAFFAPEIITDQGGIEPLLRGLASQACQALDPFIVNDVRNFLFANVGPGFDLASLNIQRGRDHGLASYNDTREAFGVGRALYFSDISSNQDIQYRLASIYGTVDDVDLWVGALSEDPVPGGHVGALIRTTLKQQFEALRDGDRFWYGQTFSPQEIEELENTKLSDIIRRNTTIGNEISDNVFSVNSNPEGLDVENITELVKNLNFEANQPPAGFTANVNGAYIKSATGWTISGTGGTWQPSAPFPDGVPEGTNVGFINNGAYMYLEIQGVTIASGKTYTVDLSVGWRDTDDEFGYSVQLLAGSIDGDILAEITAIDFMPIRGGFTSANISYTADGTYAGQSLFLKLASLANTRPVFDIIPEEESSEDDGVSSTPGGLGEENISERINNLNFEANQPPAGFTANVNGAYIKSATGWTISGTGGTWQPTAPFLNGVAEGTNAGFINDGAYMYQEIQGVTIASGKTYTVDLSVGWRDTDDEFGYSVQLLAGSIDGSILAEITEIDVMPIRGGFSLATISHTADGTYAGQSLFLKLASFANTRPVFDAAPAE